MNDYIIYNYGKKDVVVQNEFRLEPRKYDVVSWAMLWTVLQDCRDAEIVIHEVGKCLLDWS